MNRNSTTRVAYFFLQENIVHMMSTQVFKPTAHRTELNRTVELIYAFKRIVDELWR